tara:strand:- start:185 stop:490 length:306 start_codon:yes stop_codon:yes gene_type:complete
MNYDEKIQKLVDQATEILINYSPDLMEDVSLQMTFASDDLESLHFQSGDNSFSGDCYGVRNWGVVEVYKDSDLQQLAIDAIEQIADGFIETKTLEETTNEH